MFLIERESGDPFRKKNPTSLGDGKACSGIVLVTIPHLVFLLGHVTHIHQVVEEEGPCNHPEIIPGRNFHCIEPIICNGLMN